MIFRKKNNLLGLDIGSSFIKVAELGKTEKGYDLKRFGMVRTAPGLTARGSIVDMEGTAGTIRNFFEDNNIREKNVAIAAGSSSAVVKTISISKRSRKELREAIYSEAEQYIPYDINEVNIDYHILGFSQHQINLLLVALKKDLVEEYTDLISLAGLKLAVIDVDILALQNIYGILPQDRNKTVLLIDVGASKTCFNILKANVPLMITDNFSGTHQIAQELSERLGISVNEAEKAVAGENTGLIPPDIIRETGLKVAHDWCSEISEFVNAFQSGSLNRERIEKIILSGGGVLTEGFSDLLSSETEADISLINPFKGITVDRKKFPFSRDIAVRSPIALGLALRRVNDK